MSSQHIALWIVSSTLRTLFSSSDNIVMYRIYIGPIARVPLCVATSACMVLHLLVELTAHCTSITNAVSSSFVYIAIVLIF